MLLYPAPRLAPQVLDAVAVLALHHTDNAPP